MAGLDGVGLQTRTAFILRAAPVSVEPSLTVGPEQQSHFHRMSSSHPQLGASSVKTPTTGENAHRQNLVSQ